MVPVLTVPELRRVIGEDCMATIKVRTDVLRRAFSDRNMSAERVVRQAGISRNALHHVLTAEELEVVNLRTLASICQVLGITDITQIMEFIPDQPGH